MSDDLPGTDRPGTDRPGASYLAIIAVPTEVADAVLAELAREGISAFAEPLGPPDANQDDPALPEDRSPAPAQRIHVDRARIPTARAVIASRLPEVGTGFLAPHSSRDRDLTTEQVDKAWAQLVSEWEDTQAGATGGSGLSARLIRRHDPTPETSHSGEGGHGEGDEPISTPAGVGPRDYSVGDLDSLDPLEDGFVPPDPPPLPRPRHTLDTIGWSGAIGGPVLLVANQVLGWGTWVSGLGVAGFMTGFVILVSRMRNERDHDDPGAVV